jgi:hypothetical protein
MSMKLVANMLSQDRLRGMMINEQLQLLSVIEPAVDDADPKIKDDAVVTILKYVTLLHPNITFRLSDFQTLRLIDIFFFFFETVKFRVAVDVCAKAWHTTSEGEARPHDCSYRQ